MLFYFRLLRIWVKSLFLYEKEGKKVLADNFISARVMPTECNTFFTMDNSEYNRIMDICKFHLLIHYRKLSATVSKKWMPVTVSVDMSLVRPLKIFQKFQVATRLVYVNNGYMFLEHKFISNKKLHAVALTKSCFVVGKKAVKTDEICAMYGVVSPEKPEMIIKWSELTDLKMANLRKIENEAG